MSQMAHRDWHVRPASENDVAATVAAVSELLLEIGGTPPDSAAMQAVTRALLQDPEAGKLLVAEADGTLIGVLAATWQTAIHVPGRYGLIQDLWVAPVWRSSDIGTALVEAFAGVAREQRVARIEVGLPKPSFTGIAATEAFYARNGFDVHGTRMRMLLA
jgi:GNAT superfamily N-acetyltransferase